MTEIYGSLWDYSLRVYALPGVAAKCLAMQDNYDADVNILLWSLWLESEQKCLTEEKLQAALKLVSPWAATTVIPLRNIRRQMKDLYGTRNSQIEALRQTIKNAELEAERQQQCLLENLALEWTKAVTHITAGDNLEVYLRTLGVPADEKEFFVAALKELR